MFNTLLTILKYCFYMLFFPLFYIVAITCTCTDEGGGSVAEWAACRTRNPAVLGSSPALTTTWICFSVALSSNPSAATLVNSQLVCLLPVGILNNVMFSLNYLFQLFAQPH